MEKWMQLDVKNIGPKYTLCNLYCDGRCAEVVMLTDDYRLLVQDGFFIRPGTGKDSAGVVNTSRTYEAK